MTVKSCWKERGTDLTEDITMQRHILKGGSGVSQAHLLALQGWQGPPQEAGVGNLQFTISLLKQTLFLTRQSINTLRTHPMH